MALKGSVDVHLQHFNDKVTHTHTHVKLNASANVNMFRTV